MAGLSGLMNRVKKCQKTFFLLNRTPKQSLVFMDDDGEIMWEEGVEYNDKGVLAVPYPRSIDEWEHSNKKL